MNDENMINDDFIEDGEIIDMDISEVDNPVQPTPATIDIIDVDEVGVYTIDTQEAFSALGEPNENLKHTLLTDRNLPEQHEITAITGLREELNSIEALQTVYSDSKGCANYYQWADGGSQDENRLGYFVTFDYSDDISITRIKLCTDGDVYGVTTTAAAFIGGQADTPRDYRYGLVAHIGVVAVRCEVDVEVGDYVISNQFGYAKKSNSDCGYKVYAIENIHGVYYAVIDLKVPVSKLHNMASNLINLDERVERSEANIVSAINVANEAYNKADKAAQISDDAIKNALEALGVANGTASDVDGLKEAVASSNTLATQAKALADSAVLSAEALRKEAMEKATQALEEAVELREDFDQQAEQMSQALDEASNRLDQVKIDMQQEIQDALENFDDGMDDLEAVKSELEGKIQEVVDDLDSTATELQKNINSAADEINTLKEELVPLSQWPEGSDEPLGIAGFVAKTDENSSMLATMVSKVIGYETIEEVDTLNNWDSKTDKNENNIYYCIENNSYYYYGKDDKNDGQDKWRRKSDIDVVFRYAKLDQLIVYYTETKQSYWYYKDNNWLETSLPSDAGLGETLAGVRQLADENKAQFDAIAEYSKGDKTVLAGVMAYVDEHSAEISQIASLGKDVAGLTGRVDDNEAAIDLVTKYVSNTYVTVETWVEADAETDTIYYDKNTKSYWYYKDGKWNSTSDPTTAGLSSAITGIKQISDANKAELDAVADYTYTKDGKTHTSLAGLIMQVDANKAELDAITKVDGSLAGLQARVDENSAKVTTLASHTIGEYTSVGTWNEADKELDMIYYAEDEKKYYYYKDNEWKSTDKPSVAGLTGVIAGIQQTADNNEAKIASIARWQGDTDKSIAGLITKADANSAKVTTLAAHLVGEYTSIDAWNSTEDKNDKESIYYKKADDGSVTYCYYDGTSWQQDISWEDVATKDSETVYYIEALQKPYLYCKDSEWYSTDKSYEAGLTGAVAGIQQTADKNTASISMIASKTIGYETIEEVDTLDNWQSKTDKNENNIYYCIGNSSYYYYGKDQNNLTTDGWRRKSDTSVVFNYANLNMKTVYYTEYLKTYWYYDVEWKSTTKPSEAGLGETLAGVKALADENKAELNTVASYEKDGKKGLAGLSAYVDANTSEVSQLANHSFVDKDGNPVSGAAGVVARVTANQSAISNIANYQFTKKDGTVVTGLAGLNAYVNENESNVSLISKRVNGSYVVIPEWTDEYREDDTKADVTKIYYDKTDGSYYYVYDTKWRDADDWSILVLESNKIDQNTVYYVSYIRQYWYYNKSDWAYTDDAYTAGLPSAIAGIQVETDDNTSKINQLTSWQGDTETNMARIEEKANENGASIELMVSSIDTYSVGEYSQAYGLNTKQAQTILKEGMVYIPTVDHNESYAQIKYFEPNDGYIYTVQFGTKTYVYNGLSVTEEGLDYLGNPDFISDTSSDNDPKFCLWWDYAEGVFVLYTASEQNYRFGLSFQKSSGSTSISLIEYKPYKCEGEKPQYEFDVVTYIDPDETMKSVKFSRQFYYIWDDEGWQESTSGSVVFSRTIPVKQDNILYWYTDTDSPPTGYEAYALHIWITDDSDDGGYWKQVNILSGNATNRAVSMIRQTAESINAEVTNARGDAATLRLKIDSVESRIDSIASHTGIVDGKVNLALIAQRASTTSSSITLAVAHTSDTDDATIESLNGAKIVLAQNSTTNQAYISLGGWMIEENSFSYDTNDFRVVLRCPTVYGNASDGTCTVMSLYDKNTKKQPFRVTSDGGMYATKGAIAGWDITSNYLGITPDTGYPISISPGRDLWVVPAQETLSCVFYSKGNFAVTTDGAMYANSGQIGGWDINSSYLGTSSGNKAFYIASASDGAGYWIRAHDSSGACTFSVSTGGKLYATGADISGTINATTGNFSNSVTIGGTAITAGALRQLYNYAVGGTGTAITQIGATSGTVGGWTIGSQNINWVDPNNTERSIYLGHTIVWETLPNSTTVPTYGQTNWTNIIGAGYQYGQSSDRDVKNSIENLPSQYDDFFDRLIPCRFKYNYGEVDRYHTGFIAQDVLQALNDSELSTLDLAAYEELGDFSPNGAKYRLQKDEFVALNTWQIQKLKLRVATLEQELKELKSRLEI